MHWLTYGMLSHIGAAKRRWSGGVLRRGASAWPAWRRAGAGRRTSGPAWRRGGVGHRAEAAGRRGVGARRRGMAWPRGTVRWQLGEGSRGHALRHGRAAARGGGGGPAPRHGVAAARLGEVAEAPRDGTAGRRLGVVAETPHGGTAGPIKMLHKEVSPLIALSLNIPKPLGSLATITYTLTITGSEKSL